MSLSKKNILQWFSGNFDGGNEESTSVANCDKFVEEKTLRVLKKESTSIIFVNII